MAINCTAEFRGPGVRRVCVVIVIDVDATTTTAVVFSGGGWRPAFLATIDHPMFPVVIKHGIGGALCISVSVDRNCLWWSDPWYFDFRGVPLISFPLRRI